MGVYGVNNSSSGMHKSKAGLNFSSVDVSCLPFAGKKGDVPSIELPDDLVDGCLGEWKFSLFGRLDFQKLKFETAMKCLKEQWILQGNCHLIPLGKGFFVIKLDNKQDKDYVWHEKAWKVEEQYVRIKDWEPIFKPENQRSSTAFVWVHFPGLCLEFWEEKIVMTIAKGVGRPVLVDDATLKKQFGYYANVLVEVDFDKPVPDKIWVNSKLGCFYQAVELPKSPKFCNHCRIIGHIVAECRAIREVNHTESKEVVENSSANTYKRRKKNNKSKEVYLPILEEGEIESNHVVEDDGNVNISSHEITSRTHSDAKPPSSDLPERQKGINLVAEIKKVLPSRHEHIAASLSLPVAPSCLETRNRFHGLGVEEEVATSQSSVSEASCSKPSSSEPFLGSSRKASSKAKASGLFPKCSLDSNPSGVSKFLDD